MKYLVLVSLLACVAFLGCAGVQQKAPTAPVPKCYYTCSVHQVQCENLCYAWENSNVLSCFSDCESQTYYCTQECSDLMSKLSKEGYWKKKR